ncbi:hypothetical protein BU15DRAFT_62919 [Melanogaster broomeanus]|nr:hypothetical protein BU15DRAFT_62919 [Melanogaster broomeanus]
MVWLTGGYILDPADAKTWAQRRHPEIQFDHDWFITNRIDRYFQTHELNIWCICVEHEGRVMAYFVTCGIDHTTMPHRLRRFKEDRFAIAWKEKLFGGLEEELPFLKNSGNVSLDTDSDITIGRAEDVHKCTPAYSELWQ